MRAINFHQLSRKFLVVILCTYFISLLSYLFIIIPFFIFQENTNNRSLLQSLHICFSITQWARRAMLCIGARPIVDLRQKIPHRSGMHMALCSFPQLPGSRTNSRWLTKCILYEKEIGHRSHYFLSYMILTIDRCYMAEVEVVIVLLLLKVVHQMFVRPFDKVHHNSVSQLSKIFR